MSSPRNSPLNHSPSSRSPLSHKEIFASSPAKDMLKGRVIMVTGAGDGIGKVAAQEYAKYGATIILAGRTVPKLENTYDDIVSAGYREPTIYPIDFNGAQESDYEQMEILIEENLGGLDGVLFNASVLGARRALGGYYLDDWDKCMNINVRSQFIMTKALLPLLDRRPDGKILYTTSNVGRKGKAHWGAYSVSKFATEGLMQVLADDLDGISTTCVNAINPGATRTKMRALAYPAEDPSTLKTAQELMPLYLYLMGPDSAGVSGYSLDAQ